MSSNPSKPSKPSKPSNIVPNPLYVKMNLYKKDTSPYTPYTLSKVLNEGDYGEPLTEPSPNPSNTYELPAPYITNSSTTSHHGNNNYKHLQSSKIQQPNPPNTNVYNRLGTENRWDEHIYEVSGPENPNTILSTYGLKIVDNKLIYHPTQNNDFKKYDPLYIFIIKLIKDYNMVGDNQKNEIVKLYYLIKKTINFYEIINNIINTVKKQRNFLINLDTVIKKNRENEENRKNEENREIYFNLNYVQSDDTESNIILNGEKKVREELNIKDPLKIKASLDYIMICYLDLFLHHYGIDKFIMKNRQTEITIPIDKEELKLPFETLKKMGKQFQIKGGNRSKLTKLTKKHINKNKKKTHYRNGTSKKTTTQRKK